MKPTENQATITLSAADVSKIVAVCGHDGHSIIRPEALAGVNPAFVARVTQTYESDLSDPKRTITTPQGEIATELTGVYTLDALRLACSLLQLPSDAGRYYGRGRQAEAYTVALSQYAKQIN